MSDSPVAIILAAGKSTRMKSETPKVLHQVCGQSMIDHVINAVRETGVQKIVVIVGHKADEVKAALDHHSDVVFALQAEQKGTGHAVMMAEEALKDHTGSVLVLAGDTPLLKGSSLQKLLDVQQENGAACIVGTAITENNHGLGRIVRDEAGKFLKIVEHKDASEVELQIQEINTGCFAFQTQSLFAALKKLRPENQQAEYYLTDCAEILLNEGKTVLAANTLDIQEAMGVNTQDQLAEVEKVMLNR
ncbi:NTP transferase domain-containing protein [Rubinisphaera italica]|uniref:Bifunctional protein GlmU n=1 Tax=Rubinisphaera italica TaxID=2527969 RepID=A0A5C5XIH3_9PLAN|nr:NTP transferase domain-containing protein [Rubinisphaera italica]TWT62123.1 Bifunctional protein GlmU [Rubinisphaera italica]